MISPRTKIHGLSFLILFLFYLAGLYGVFYSFTSSFSISVQEQVLFVGILVTAVVLWALYFLGKAARIIVPVALLGMGIWAFSHYEQLLNQVWLVSNELRQAINLYFVMEMEPLITNSAMGADTTFLCMLVMIIIALLLFFGMVIRTNRPLVLLITLIPSAGALMVGRIPSFWSLSLLGFCYIGIFSTGRIEFRYRNRKFLVPGYYRKGVAGYSALIMGMAAVILFGISNAVISPRMDEISVKTKELRSGIQNNTLMETVRKAFPKLRLSMSGAGQVDSGELGGSVFFTGEEALEITLDHAPGETMYLKGYTGKDYDGKRWGKDDDSAFFEAYGNQASDVESRRKELLEAPYALGLALEDVFGENLGGNAVIKRKPASSDRIYRPYISKEFYEETGEEKDAHAFSYMEREDFTRLLNESSGLSLSNVSLWSYNYSDYVYQNYLSFPEERLGRLKELCDRNPLTDFDEIREFVVSTVSGSAVYNLQAPVAPASQDFVDYFMFDSHEGYCVHFASTAVLMFRMYGIPARYAAGYIAPASEFSSGSDDKYVAHIKDEKAHAWAEIYVEDEGWMPVEATPGYVGAGNTTSQTESETQIQKVTESVPGQTERQTEKETGSGTGEADRKDSNGGALGSTQAKIILLILFIAAGILAFVLFVMIRRNLILSKRQKEDIRGTFIGMYDVMILGGLSRRYDGTEHYFTDMACEKFPGIPREELALVMELVMRANYGDGRFTQEELRRVRSVYHQVCREVYQGLSGAEKLEFKYVKVFE